MQNEDRQEISDTLKLLIHNNTKCQDMSGKKIYGNIQKVEKKNITGMTYQLSNETGHGEITVYRVFTGIELYYNDMHMEYCNQNQATVKNMIEINHCLIGRFECSFGENSCCYMAEGEIALFFCLNLRDTVIKKMTEAHPAMTNREKGRRCPMKTVPYSPLPRRCGCSTC